VKASNGEPTHLTTEGSSNPRQWRSNLSRLGYVLVGCSVFIVAGLWSRTCALGGFHCFDDYSGQAMAAAQIGVVVGLLCSLFGGGAKRLLFAGIAFFELLFCYSRLLTH
jgi:hypothetical protein